MKTPKHNEKNITRLAEEVTDSSDIGTIIRHFYESQYEYYENDKEAFLTDWEDMEIEDE